ncbi:type II toxin-antitoxin system mRNA interferase toxin, RelE/StbE family [Candidatus Daviesbacteria bacterium]|nr:type II toxin-antitoxin system mRNA interferase toxin, RelE/StbE family [Candidatus Daviesbacteria bacterium]
MKIRQIVYSKSFAKKLAGFSQKDQEKFLQKIRLFWQDPFTPSLKTHKLTGKLKNYWSFSVSFNLRVMFQFAKQETVAFIDIGGHEIYK